MKLLVYTLSTVLFILNPSSTDEAENWVLKKNKEGVKISVNENAKEGLADILVITKVRCGINEVVTLLENVNAYCEWTPNLERSKILEKLSTGEMYYYVEFHSPWPLDNRDNIVHFNPVYSNPDSVVIHVNGVRDYLPENDGIERIKKSFGYWRLTKHDNDSTEIYMRYTVEFTSNFPVWIIRYFVINNIHKMFVNLKKRVENLSEVNSEQD